MAVPLMGNSELQKLSEYIAHFPPGETLIMEQHGEEKFLPKCVTFHVAGSTALYLSVDRIADALIRSEYTFKCEGYTATARTHYTR